MLLGERKEMTKMTNEAKVTHDAYVSIGWDELFYVGCDGCPDTIFGPTGNEFEANGKALDHERNPPSTPMPALAHLPLASDPTVIAPTRPGAAWSVGQWESEPPEMQVAPPSHGDGPPVGAFPPGVPATFAAEDLAKMPVKRPGPVTLQDRQGVFVHSFKCSICDLEFVVFSWRADRHRVGVTFCPECGERTPMLHWRAQASDSLDFQTDGTGLEIYQMCPPLEGALMDDFVVPPDSRYISPEDQLEATEPGSVNPQPNGEDAR
jgi:hypothetical protein